MVPNWYYHSVAINVRFTDDNEAAVKRQAEAEGISINTMINKAVAEYVARHDHRDRAREILDVEMGRWAELLDRLK